MSGLRSPEAALLYKRQMKKTYETPALEELGLEMETDFLGGSVQDGGSERVREEGDDLFG